MEIGEKSTNQLFGWTKPLIFELMARGATSWATYRNAASSTEAACRSASACCKYSFIGNGSIWPEPEAEVWTLTANFLPGPYPASCISFCADGLSYLIWKLGLPRQG